MLKDSEEFSHGLDEAFHFLEIFVSYGGRGIHDKCDVRRILALGEFYDNNEKVKLGSAYNGTFC